MKGFPNQVADLTKIATGISTLVGLVDAGENARNNGVFGEALVRSGVAGTGHRPMDVEEYLRLQRLNTPDNQSFRTTARGLRQLYRLLGLIDDSGGVITLSAIGRQAAAFADAPMDGAQVEFWRRAIQSLSHDGSHPYQVLLRLVGQKPGITRAKCALALEAIDDSPGELARIVALADLTEVEIRNRIRVTKSNWDNAKKVLPKFAEQLGDVIQTGDCYRLADAPGRNDAGPADDGAPPQAGQAPRVRTPRTSRAVTSDSIGRAGTGERHEEFQSPPNVDPAAAAAAIRLRLDRLRRHNLIVQELARRLANLALYEDPFDMLAILATGDGLLIEVKTLDGTIADQRDRVRHALGQLLYYEPFVAIPVVGDAGVHKVGCFEGPISDEHQAWLNQFGIAVIWKVDGGFAGDELAARILGDYLQELR